MRFFYKFVSRLLFKRVQKIITLFLLSLLVCLVLYRTLPKKKTNPNLLLITVDALRPDHLGAYGYKVNVSPTIDSLANEGILFRTAIAHSSWTAPSVASLLTSRLPSDHMVFGWENLISEKLITFPELLKKNGYHNHLCSAHDNTMFSILGLKKAFNGWTKQQVSLEAEELNEEAFRFLKKNRGKNFFLWLHYMDVHKYNMKHLGIPRFKTSEEKKKFFLRNYDEGIKTVDENLGKLIAKLKELKLYDNTLIIFTADHGEELCEHGSCFKHGDHLWDTVIKVPLIIVAPKLNHKEIEEQVRQIDLAPTILDFLKLKVPETFSGRSLLPLIRGEKIETLPALSEYMNLKYYGKGPKNCITRVSLRTEKWKMVFNCFLGKKEYLLFDIINNPAETIDFSAKEKEIFHGFKNNIDEWVNVQGNNIKIETRELDLHSKERLKSLGYLE